MTYFIKKRRQDGKLIISLLALLLFGAGCTALNTSNNDSDESNSPDQVSALSSQRTSAQVTLSWENPTDEAFNYVIIKRATSDVTLESAEILATSNLTSYTDLTAEGPISYYYGFYTVDDDENYSSLSTIFVETTAITFPDANLLSVVREYLNIAEGPIYQEDVTELTNLYCGYRDISSIEGIQYFTGLISFAAGGNMLRDISPVAEMTQLTYLNLADNQLSDISSLENLTNLTNLGLQYNNISELSPLSGLSSLTLLSLNNNNITDIDPLLSLTTLQTLIIDYNFIDSDELTSLTDSLASTTIYSTNQQDDLSMITGTTEVVFEDDNLLEQTRHVTNIIEGPIYQEQVEMITTLNLANKNISDLTGLEAFTGLRYLNLNANTPSITSIS